MLAFTAAPRGHLFLRTSRIIHARAVSTLASNPHIHIFPHPTQPATHILTLLPTTPPNPDLAIGTTPTIPPTPDSLTENPHFTELLHSVLSEHATRDPEVQAQAAAFASTGGSGLGSGGAFFSPPPAQNQRLLKRQERARQRTGNDGGTNPAQGKGKAIGGGGGAGQGGAGGASAQGGMGGAGVGGFVHVSDQRNPPDWGRVAWSEDIFGSLEVDGAGGFVGARGGYQRSGTYRVVTREGVLGLSRFLRERVVERLRGVEADLGGRS